jgi:hypothetical protein
MNIPVRVKAASIHLTICIFIACLLSLLVFLVWYPSPLNVATGVLHIFLLIVMVDIVIGPLITLIIYNPKKKELKWDLTVIAVLQLLALIYGLVVVHASRPVYVVFNVDRFDLIQAKDLTPEKLAKAKLSQFKKLPQFGQQFVVAVRPEDLEERQKMLFDSLNGGDDLPFLPQYYEPYAKRIEDVKLKLIDLGGLGNFNKDKLAEVEELKKKYAKRKVLAKYIPLKGLHKDLSVIINEKNGEVLEIVDLKPWE